jgi:hypothetical protein
MGPRDEGDPDLPGNEMTEGGATLAESFDPLVGIAPPAPKPRWAPRWRPSAASILPHLADRVVNDVRDGYALEAICERQHCDAEVALAMIERSYANGLLLDYEVIRIRRGHE